MAREYKVISGDSHMELAPERWTPRVPAKYRDVAPKTVKLDVGGDGIAVGGEAPNPLGVSVTGTKYEEHKLFGVSFEGSAGTGSPEQRLKEQDQDGVDAEILFFSPQMAVLWRNIKDPAAYRAMFRAWNDFMAEDYCSAAPDRLIGLGLVPDTTLDDAVDELEHCAKLGLKGVILGSFPNGHGYPLPEDDRFWAAAVATKLGVTCHSSLRDERVHGSQPVFQYPKEPPALGLGAGNPVGHLSRFAGPQVRNPAQLAWSGVFDRFPALRLYFAETQIGWLPYALQQFDSTYERDRYWAERDYGLEPMERRPSEYVMEHCYWGFLYDPAGAQHEVGAKRGMWGSDFPHLSGDWPYSRNIIEKNFVGVSEESQRRMLAENAIEFFHL